jgi:3-phosphoglycerate kinase
VVRGIASSSALTYVCGSDTTEIAHKLKLSASHTHFARGSGAPRLLLQGKPVPGLEALTEHADGGANASAAQPATAGT